MLAGMLAAAGFAVRPALAGSASPQCLSVSAPPTSLPPLAGTPLGTIAASKNLLLGTQLAVADDTAYGTGMYDPVYRQLIARERLGLLAYGSAFKFDSVCPDPPTPEGELVFTQKAFGVTNTWFAANDLTRFAKAKGCRARADALIWNGTATAPPWLEPLPLDAGLSTPAYQYNLSYLIKYVSAAMQKMTMLQAGDPGFFHAACLINEPIVPNFGNPQSPSPATFRGGPWLPPGRPVGTRPKVPDYILQAFEHGELSRHYWATRLRQPATSAKFFVNEALCETDQFGPVMRPALLALLEAMRAARLNIQAVGLECHLQPQMMHDPFHPDWTAFGAFIQEIAALGLDIYITELDVVDYETSCFGHAGSPQDSDSLIDTYYKSFLAKVLSCKAVKAVTLWDMSDRYSFYRYEDESKLYGYDRIARPRPPGTPWPSCATLPSDAQSIACPRPDAFDDQMAQKPARQAIAAALGAAPTR